MRGIPNKATAGGFLKAGTLARSIGGNAAHRSLASRREGGIKILDITEQPLVGREAKRRRRQLGESAGRRRELGELIKRRRRQLGESAEQRRELGELTKRRRRQLGESAGRRRELGESAGQRRQNVDSASPHQ